MTHYLPMLLMFLAASSRTSSSSSAAATTPKPSGSAVRAKPAAAVKPKPAATKPASKAPAKPAVKPPATAEEAAAQAAVNAVIVDAIKRQVDTGVAMAQAAPAPAPAAKPALTIDVPKRSPADAAAALRDFLRRTRKYGSKKAPVPEVKAAQADMGSLTVDGIVGPKTRARAKALGVTLP